MPAPASSEFANSNWSLRTISGTIALLAGKNTTFTVNSRNISANTMSVERVSANSTGRHNTINARSASLTTSRCFRFRRSTQAPVNGENSRTGATTTLAKTASNAA